ncbi:hypothetical protein OA40_06610 [Morganella morganii]|nr:hypothetical protein OA40_06610 [Morganella morganii]
MEPTQGIQGYQAIQILNNDIYDSAGSNSSSSYVSSSGIKSVLLNAWNTVKSAVSGMLSSFGLHLSGQQGSDKPGREIVMDMSCRPLPPLPLPGIDEQFDKTINGGNNNEDTYSEIDENESSEVDDLENNFYEDPDVYQKGNSETETTEADALANHIYEDLDVYRDTDNVIDSGNMVLVCDDTYAVPHDSLTAGGRVESEETGYASLYENNYAVPYKPGNTVSIPDNDRKHSLSDVQLQQRIMREKLNTL